jgi:hypothetical protein
VKPVQLFSPEVFELWKVTIDIDGWTNTTIREFAFINRPYIKVGRPYGKKPPENKQEINRRDMVDLNIQPS